MKSDLSMVADLVHFAHCVVDSDNTTYIVIAFLSCRLVASETRQNARCWTFVLSSCRWRSTSNGALSCGALSRCRPVAWRLYIYKKPILRFKPSNNVTSRQQAARQHAVWRASLATGRQNESPTTSRFGASDNTTHKGVPYQPPYTSYFPVGKQIEFNKSFHFKGLKAGRPVILHQLIQLKK
jgi:hypothetical protein